MSRELENYELDAAWAPYYSELDPKRRLEILSALSGDDGDLRHQLYRERYQDPKHPGRGVDNWLWKCVYLPGVYRRGFFKGAARREMQETLKELRLDRFETFSNEDKAALYWEFRNTARRYLSTCHGDGYGSSLFGLKRTTEEEKRLKTVEDVWMMSRGVALAYGLEEEMRPWWRAFHAELLEFDPGCAGRYEELEAKFRG